MTIARWGLILLYVGSLLSILTAHYAAEWSLDAPLRSLSVEASNVALVLFPNSLLIFTPPAAFELAFGFTAIAGLALWGWFAKSLAPTVSLPRVIATGVAYASVSLAVFMFAFAHAMSGLATSPV